MPESESMITLWPFGPNELGWVSKSWMDASNDCDEHVSCGAVASSHDHRVDKKYDCRDSYSLGFLNGIVMQGHRSVKAHCVVIRIQKTISASEIWPFSNYLIDAQCKGRRRSQIMRVSAEGQLLNRAFFPLKSYL